jgi:hypothetical protein
VQFSSRYIEEITRKTGNYKKFTVRSLITLRCSV